MHCIENILRALSPLACRECVTDEEFQVIPFHISFPFHGLSISFARSSRRPNVVVVVSSIVWANDFKIEIGIDRRLSFHANALAADKCTLRQ